MLTRRLLVVFFACATVLGCDSPDGPTPPPPPPPPPVEAPALSCPADIAVEVDAVPTVLTYQEPVASGGTSPVTTHCTIPSGSAFRAGTTDVICTATDAISRQAQCVFKVSVTEIHLLVATKFLAFGDSITAGEVTALTVSRLAIDKVNNYPTVLEGRLKQRYSTQPVTVVNAGSSGKNAVDDEDRLVDAMRAQAPDVVLLMHGYNDVKPGFSVGAVAQSLRADVGRAKRQPGVKAVLLSTLVPQVARNSNDPDRAYYPEGVPMLNDAIRQIAFSEGAVLVDSFLAVEPLKDFLIGEDGLHPTVQGYAVIADTFLRSIQSNLEQPRTVITSMPSLLRQPRR